MKFCNHVLYVLLALSLTTATFAQEHKVAMSSGKLIILGVDKVDIEGYSGNEVILSSSSSSSRSDDRAAGLKVISSDGKVDNTGIGLSAQKDGSELTIEQVKKSSKGRYHIKVPKGVSIYYEHQTNTGSKVNITDVSSEIEMTTQYNSITLDNVTGPMSINTIYGKIEAVFGTVSQSNPITLRSTYGLIDVAVPASTKADLRLKTSYGDMFTDLNIDQTSAKSHKHGDRDDCGSCRAQLLEGKINGGGVLFDLTANYGNIYLRKKQ